MEYSIGVDIGGTSIKLGIVSEEGKLLSKWEIDTRKGENGLIFIRDIAEEIKKALDKDLALSIEDISGVGIGIPGPVLSDGYVEVGVNLDVKDIYPAKILSELMGGMTVKVANDANVAALGEMWQGAGKGYDSICMVTLGTGVGGGIVNEGKIVFGMHGAGGEIGHICIDPAERERCNCGGHGCVEQYASATGIRRVAKRMLRESDIKSGLRSIGNISAKDVCDLAKEGDEIALKSLSYSMDKLAQGLSFVSMIADPQVFVIGGGVSKAGPFLTDMIRNALKRYCTIVDTDRYDVALAMLGNDAGIYGAAKMMF